MRSPVPDYLAEVLDACSADESGAPADYIPELAAADPDRFGVCLTMSDGEVYTAGDADVPFSIQSISKPFAYAIALEDAGIDDVLAHVGVEPSGEPFNQISLETDTGRPKNPMINAGAIATHSLIGSEDGTAAARERRVLDVFSAAAGRELSIDESVAESEMSTAYRNLAIANLLRGYDVLTTEPSDAVLGYVRQCSISVTTRDLAMMAATLATGGIQPNTGERVFSLAATRYALSVMSTCGMYDASGEWMTRVGIPSKSGVSGGLIGSLPGQLGVATFSPRLDSRGNSVRGIELFERLSRDMGMHLMEAPSQAVSGLRGRYERVDDSRAIEVVELQGEMQFSSAEGAVRRFTDIEPGDNTVVMDLSRVHSVNDVARRVLLEVVRRLGLDGHEVVLVDPDSVLPDPDRGDGVRPRVVNSTDEV
ncbi:glutaminase [Rhodococcus rhodnii]|uniref:Glutaminase n=2 Tax=Rhodococcus rhodnii TaxID=38312 RepID=R7WKK2_9NOCA|nr:glutaminase [Rhodococcus rhodnii]EOM75823.1 glutaminase [Rhodococcus rhodnii LMG 5362]TXG91006.1 glutaminase [Rhodococcus rhodnii]